MSRIIEINKNEADPDIVKYLEECLDGAKNGQILECVVVGRMVGGDRLYSQMGYRKSKFEMMGMLIESTIRYCNENMD